MTKKYEAFVIAFGISENQNNYVSWYPLDDSFYKEYGYELSPSTRGIHISFDLVNNQLDCHKKLKDANETFLGFVIAPEGVDQNINKVLKKADQIIDIKYLISDDGRIIGNYISLQGEDRLVALMLPSTQNNKGILGWMRKLINSE